MKYCKHNCLFCARAVCVHGVCVCVRVCACVFIETSVNAPARADDDAWISNKSLVKRNESVRSMVNSCLLCFFFLLYYTITVRTHRTIHSETDCPMSIRLKKQYLYMLKWMQSFLVVAYHFFFCPFISSQWMNLNLLFFFLFHQWLSSNLLRNQFYKFDSRKLCHTVAIQSVSKTRTIRTLSLVHGIVCAYA